jgi:hypothetical protein
VKSEAGDSLEMIKRELAESAEVIHQEMEAVLERSLLNVTQDVVALRERGERLSKKVAFDELKNPAKKYKFGGFSMKNVVVDSMRKAAKEKRIWRIFCIVKVVCDQSNIGRQRRRTELQYRSAFR